MGIVAPFPGQIGVGVNDRKPQDNKGQIEFSITVYNPKPGDWRRPGQTIPCATR